jgi:hypothetical protein
MNECLHCTSCRDCTIWIHQVCCRLDEICSSIISPIRLAVLVPVTEQIYIMIESVSFDLVKLSTASNLLLKSWPVFSGRRCGKMALLQRRVRLIPNRNNHQNWQFFSTSPLSSINSDSLMKVTRYWNAWRDRWLWCNIITCWQDSQKMHAILYICEMFSFINWAYRLLRHGIKSRTQRGSNVRYYGIQSNNEAGCLVRLRSNHRSESCISKPIIWWC